MANASRKGPSWLAACGGVLLLPTALWWVYAALSSPIGVITLVGLLSFALVVSILLGAWAAWTTPRPMLWGKIILGSSFFQFFLGLGAWWPIAVAAQIPALILLGAVLLGVILGMMSGIWLIAEQRGSPEQT